IVSAWRNWSTDRMPSDGVSLINAIGSVGNSLCEIERKQPVPASAQARTSAPLARRAAPEALRLGIPVEERGPADARLSHRDHELRPAGIQRLAVGAERAGDVGVRQIRRGVDMRVIDAKQPLPCRFRSTQRMKQLLLVDPERAGGVEIRFASSNPLALDVRAPDDMQGTR